METIDIKGLDHAEVLKALYDAAKPQGLGILHYTPDPLDIEEARELVANHSHPRYHDGEQVTGVYLDYHRGRVMKVLVGGDRLDPRLYDRDNGAGAAARALEPLLQKREVA